MLQLTRRAVLGALAPALLVQSLPSLAASPPAALSGTYALPDGLAKVSGSLAVLPARPGGPATTRILDITMTPLGSTRPVTRYDVELSKRLHVIAVSDDMTTFLHEHGDRPDTDGHFRVPMTFPHAGIWHVYADAVPTGLGQQVLRFEVNLGGPPLPRRAALQPTGRDGADGRYGVRFDALDLQAGQEAALSLQILRDGVRAPDVTPYLGVAAHAVFIDAADLTYVHAHATPAAAQATSGAAAPMKHDMPGMPGMAMPEAGGAPMRLGKPVSPGLTLHVRAPKAGTYLLWLQFMAGGQVRTVPFVVAVT